MEATNRCLETTAAVETVAVPQDYHEKLLERPPRRPRPRSETFFNDFPELRDHVLAADAAINSVADVQDDILRQFREKGTAEVKVEIMADGKRRAFCDPLPHGSQPINDP